MALTGLDFHQLDSFRKVSSAHSEFPSPKLCLAQYFDYPTRSSPSSQSYRLSLSSFLASTKLCTESQVDPQSMSKGSHHHVLECAPRTGEVPSQVEYGPISGFHV